MNKLIKWAIANASNLVVTNALKFCQWRQQELLKNYYKMIREYEEKIFKLQKELDNLRKDTV